MTKFESLKETITNGTMAPDEVSCMVNKISLAWCNGEITDEQNDELIDMMK